MSEIILNSNSLLKILQINSVSNSGSTGRIMENIGLVIKEAGHHSCIAYGRGGGNSELDTIKIGSQLDVYIHGAITLLMDKHGFGSTRATKDFIKKIEVYQPDAIGLHNIHGYYINIQLLFNYLRNKNIPVLWTFHDSWPFTGHCTYFDSVNCEKWLSGCQNCPKKKEYPRSLVDNSKKNYLNKRGLFSSLNNLHIITPSHWLKTNVKRSYLKNFDVSVIHNGIDLQAFKPNQMVRKEKLILGVASIWDKRKGLNDFHSLRLLLDDEWKIVLIGLSKEQLKDLPKGISGIARTEDIQELVNWYSRSLCYVNPTYQDNFPTTNIEAIACGTPVITYNTGGSPEAIDKETGCVVQQGNIQGLLEAILYLESLDNITLSKACRKRAETLFDKKVQFLEYLKIYKQITHLST